MKTLNIIEGYNNFHFIGIGGINMSGLAEILHNDGCTITGSDRNDSDIIAALRKRGISVKIGHDAQNISIDAQIIIYNAAVPDDNPEILEAKTRGLRLMDRAELLGRLMQNYGTAICVAGTHGKTTTTSMLAEIFMAADKDPTVMNGGVLPSMGGALRIGSRDFIIVEACEYNDSFLKFHPNIGIILNLEMDHSDYFANINALRASFRGFVQRIPEDGLLVINGGIEDVEQIHNGLNCNKSFFGINTTHQYIDNVCFDDFGHGRFDICSDSGKLGEIVLKVPGHHNIQNALAAIYTALHCGIDFNTIATALTGFTGAVRRFQHIGQYNGANIVDDYAHHPTEVAATIQAARNVAHNRLWVVFQPHTRERTAEFLNEFAKELAHADELVILDIFNPAGREEEHCKVHATDLAELAIKENSANCNYLPSFDICVDFLKQNIDKGDLVITMGAGDVHKVAEILVLQYSN